MTVGEEQAFACETIDVGSLELGLGIDRTHVAVALIVRVDDDDVGLFDSEQRQCRPGDQQQERNRETNNDSQTKGGHGVFLFSFPFSCLLFALLLLSSWPSPDPLLAMTLSNGIFSSQVIVRLNSVGYGS